VVGGGVGGISGLMFLMGVSVDQLNADLFGEGQLDLLASGGSQLGDALLNGLGTILNLGNGDALLLSEVGTADTGKGDGLVDAGLDGLGEGNGHININGSDDRDIVLGLLGDLLAVVVAIRSISISLSGLADSDHLDIVFLNKGDLNSLGGGSHLLLLVRVRADLVVNQLNGLSADGTGDIIAKLFIDNALDGQVNILADGLEGRGADLSDLSHISDSAVVLGFFITIVGGGRVAVGRGSMAIGWGRVAISRGMMGVGGGGMVGFLLIRGGLVE
jgi:hypothetical protein